jgi:L-seryl-tRNA(Ser) seleniumtransferase
MHMKAEIREALRRLPSVDEALRALDLDGDEEIWPRWAVVQAVRDQIEQLRQQVLGGRTEAVELEPERVKRRVDELLAPSLRPVFNATGVVLHTNLGRAPLSEEVLRRIARIAAGYSNLEYALEQRRRGSRHVHAADLLRRLSGADDAVVVNNNAGAVLLCLAALAQDREVVVSRGELIEIGGSFRLPDVMAASGAILREVGTTNRTHPQDYERAIGAETALLLKAHRSNFAVVGFTREVEPDELVAIGRAHDLPTMFDLGSGCLLDLAEVGLPGEPTVQRVVRSGFDLVTFSGDKLLGGPQAGLIVGRADAVAKVRSHPLMRPLRPDKMTLAGVEATLEAYRDGEAVSRLPALAMLAASDEALEAMATRLLAELRRLGQGPWAFELRQVQSKVGGGALPLAALGSWAVSIEHPELGADAIEQRLRGADPPVIARIDRDLLVLDVRTIGDDQVLPLAKAVAAELADDEQRRPA